MKKMMLVSAVALMAAGNAFAASTATDDAAKMKTEMKATETTTMAPATTMTPGATDTFIATQTEGQWLASSYYGAPVYGAAGEEIGDINDLVLGADGKIVAAVVGVGGFLGIGEKDVAVPFPSITIKADGNDDMRLVLTSTKEELEAAPAFERGKTRTYWRQTMNGTVDGVAAAPVTTD